MDECPRAGRWFGCKFEGRYDLRPIDLSGASFDGSYGGLAMILDQATNKTYVRDVCIRCGRTIEREGRKP